MASVPGSRWLRTFYYLLGPKQRRQARRLYYFPVDFFENILGRRQPLVPPRGLIFTGRGDYVATGDLLLAQMKDHCGLQSRHRVLDVGCGIGRMARPLAGFLSPPGSYEGFDVVKAGIDWCQKHYRHLSHFGFQHIPLRNDLYNLTTREDASHFDFPYSSRFFHHILLISVFTHMQPAEVKHYLAQMGRVLKPGGHCFITMFLIDHQSETALQNTPRPFFPHNLGNYFLHDAKVVNANVAFRKDFFHQMAEEAQLELKKVHQGWWRGLQPKDCLNFQDVVILRKPDA